ncbi:MAG: zinc metalloprotease HtpX [Candidatus Pacearchaeota archaeon]|nr:zinc metalloprotease HtpX [Candidatus Pacearchaeota archaeon]
MDNRLKTFLLLLLLTALVVFIGSLFGRTGLIVALAVMLVLNFVTYWWSDRIILMMYRARQVSKHENPWLHEIVGSVAKEAGIPKPKIYIVPLQIQNAFATGRNPKNAAVAVTEGILHSLNRDELKGVIAHEISHIKNRDILVMTIAAILAGVIMFMANMARFSAFSISDRDSRGSILGLLFIAILAPIAAMLIQMAISRSREYLADESGARLIKDGEPLAQALLKLHKSTKLGGGAETTAHLFIVNPLSAGGIATLFSTHPPVEERVKRLRAIKI